MVSDLRQSRCLERIDALSAERGLGVLRGHRHLEKEHAQQRPEWGVGQAALVGGCVAALARVRVFAEQSVDGVFGIINAA